MSTQPPYSEEPTESTQAWTRENRRYSGGGSGGGRNRFWLPAVILVLVLLIAVGAFALLNNDDDSADTSIGSGEWQAVFLTNGQVYFGHITSKGDENFTLEDVFYLQVQEQVQPPKGGQTAQPDVSLGKLGRFELHCPQDKMIINREHILFWEDLKNSSQVVTAIEEYRKSGDAEKDCYEGQQTQQPTTTTTTAGGGATTSTTAPAATTTTTAAPTTTTSTP